MATAADLGFASLDSKPPPLKQHRVGFALIPTQCTKKAIKAHIELAKIAKLSCLVEPSLEGDAGLAQAHGACALVHLLLQALHNLAKIKHTEPTDQ